MILFVFPIVFSINVFEALPGILRQFWGTGDIGDKDFEFGEQGNRAIYFQDGGGVYGRR